MLRQASVNAERSSHSWQPASGLTASAVLAGWFFAQSASVTPVSCRSSRLTTWSTPQLTPISSSTTATTAASRATSQAVDGGIAVDGELIKVFAERDPAQIPWGDCRRRHRHRVDRLLHRRHQGRGSPPRQRQEGDHQRPGLQRRRDHRPRRQRRDLRPGAPPRDLQRLLHHQRPCAAGQGAGGRVRPAQGPDDHDPLLHQLAADPRPRRPQGPARGPQRRHQHRPDCPPALRERCASSSPRSTASSMAWPTAYRRRPSRSSRSSLWSTRRRARTRSTRSCVTGPVSA